ncbi:protein DMR6-LIKE OXYGENASE 2 [Citrus sinensis]|nr:protein DMR6-LIKE OXYGENASE 2 [Citrus sinensis]
MAAATTKLLLSDLASTVKSVPSNYIRPISDRPNLTEVQISDGSIPLIDLQVLDGPRRLDIIKQIGQACQHDGFFQVKNHGIPETIINSMLSITRAFFKLPESERLKSYSDDPSKSTRLSTSFNVNTEKVSNWRDYLRLHCYPLQDYIHEWPSNPPSFREVVAEYCTSARGLVLRLLEAISESLGLQRDYIDKALGKHRQHMALNYYPHCPQPDLTYGLPGHIDPNLITVLLQDDVPGLQVLRKGKWLPVNPIPNTFIVKIGDQMQVLSNDRYKSVLHRALVNCDKERISIPTFYCPSPDAVIAPAKDLIDERHPALLFRPRPGSLLNKLNHDEDLSSYAFFSKNSCVHRNKSEHTGHFPGVNPLTLKSEMKETGLADGVFVDEQNIPAPVLLLLGFCKIYLFVGTLLVGICSSRLVSSKYIPQTPVPQFLVLGNVVSRQWKFNSSGLRGGMSKGKEKVIEIEDDELGFLPSLLAGPAFDPEIPLETIRSSVGTSARRMSPQITSLTGNSDDEGSSGSEDTLSKDQGDDSGEMSSPGTSRPDKRSTLGGRALSQHYAIDFITCMTTVDELTNLRVRYGIPDEVPLRIPGKKDTPSRPSRGYVTLFLDSFKLGLRCLIQPYFARILNGLNLAPGQLNPNGWRVLSSLFILWDRCCQSDPTIDEVKHLYQLKSSPKDADWNYFQSSTKTRKPITDLPTGSSGTWKKKFFFAGGPWGQVAQIDGKDYRVPPRFVDQNKDAPTAKRVNIVQQVPPLKTLPPPPAKVGETSGATTNPAASSPQVKVGRYDWKMKEDIQLPMTKADAAEKKAGDLNLENLKLIEQKVMYEAQLKSLRDSHQVQVENLEKEADNQYDQGLRHSYRCIMAVLGKQHPDMKMDDLTAGVAQHMDDEAAKEDVEEVEPIAVEEENSPPRAIPADVAEASTPRMQLVIPPLHLRWTSQLRLLGLLTRRPLECILCCSEHYPGTLDFWSRHKQTLRLGGPLHAFEIFITLGILLAFAWLSRSWHAWLLASP